MKKTIRLEGMHCASCATNIEKSLKKIKGIKDANVNLVAKKGFIEIEDNFNISDEELKKAVSKVGNYRITKIDSEEISRESMKHEMKDEMHLSHEHSHNHEHA